MARRQLSLLPALRNSFDALITEHALSKKRYSEKTTDLTKSLKAEEDKAKLSLANEERLRAENLAKSREVGRLGDEMAKLRSQKGDVEQALSKATDVNKMLDSDKAAVQAGYELLKEQYATLDAETRQQCHTVANIASITLQHAHTTFKQRYANALVRTLAAQYATFRSERKLGQAHDQITELVDLVESLEDEAELSADRLNDSALENEQLRWELARCQAIAGAERVRHQDALRDAREEITAIRDELALAHAESRIEASIARSVAKESRLYRKERDQLESILEDTCFEKLELAGRLQHREPELDAAQAKIESQTEALAAERSKVESLTEQTGNLTEQLEATTDDLHEVEVELTAHKQRLDESLSALTISRNHETALQAEVEALQDDLTEYHVLQERHEDLQKMLDRVLRTSNLAEEDAAELARINADLAGHANPNQKIRHLERLRHDLAASKKVRFLAVRTACPTDRVMLNRIS